jgi:outer membrane protein TolC
MRGILSIFPMLLLAPLLAGQPLTWLEARDKALAHDLALQSAQTRVAVADYNRRAAFADYLPTVALEGGVRWDRDLMHYDTGPETLPVYDLSAGYPQIDPTKLVGFRIDQDLGQHTNAQWKLEATQPLFTGGKIWRNNRIHRDLTDVARLQADQKRQEVILGADEAYWRLAELQEKVRLAQKYRDAVQAHLDDLNNYLYEGLATRNEVLRARVRLSEADLGVQQVNDGLALAKMDLNRRIGGEGEVVAVDSLNHYEIGPYPHDLPGVEIRPELKAMEKVLHIDRELAGIKLAAFMPQIALQADYTLTRPNPYNSFADEYGDTWQLALVCKWNLIDFNRRGHEYNAAKRQAEADRVQYDDTRELIRLQVDQERFRMEEAQQRVIMRLYNVQQAEENLRQATEQFHEGVLKSTDLLDAQTLWLQARTGLIEAESERFVQTTRWMKACGYL